jgi:hypothetical protein
MCTPQLPRGEAQLARRKVTKIDRPASIEIMAFTSCCRAASRAVQTGFEKRVIKQVDSAVFVTVRWSKRKPESTRQFEFAPSHPARIGLADRS